MATSGSWAPSGHIAFIESAWLQIGVMITYDATVKCIALPLTFFRKQKKSGHLNSWVTEVQWKTWYMWSVVVLLAKTVHEFCRSLSRRSFVSSLSISLRIQPPISYKPIPFTVKVLENYRWALTREQRGRGSLNFLPLFLEFNSIRLMWSTAPWPGV